MLTLSDISAFVSRAFTPAAKSVEEYLCGTVRSSEANQPKYAANSGQAELVKRALQTVAFCAHTNASVCSTAKIRLYRKGKGKAAAKALSRAQRKWLAEGVTGKAAQYGADDDVVEVLEHPALDLLRKPNPWQTGMQAAYQRFWFQDIAGNAYWYATDAPENFKAVPGRAEPKALFTLFPQYTTVKPSTETLIEGYYYGRERSQVAFFPAEDVVHFKYAPHPDSPYLGVGPLHACYKEADLTAYATEAEIYRWLQGGQPPAVLSLPETAGTKEREDAELMLQKRMGGIKNAGRWLVTIGGEVKATGFPPKDMDYQNGMTRADLVIARNYGVPASYLDTNKGNLTSAGAGRIQHRQDAIEPRLTNDQDELTHGYLPRFRIEPGDMFFAYDNCVPEDEAAAATRVVALYGGGIITKNEARAECGYEPVPDGDDFKERPEPMGMGGGAFGGKPGEKPRPGKEEEDERADGSGGDGDNGEKSHGQLRDGGEGRSTADHGTRRGGRERDVHASSVLGSGGVEYGHVPGAVNAVRGLAEAATEKQRSGHNPGGSGLNGDGACQAGGTEGTGANDESRGEDSCGDGGCVHAPGHKRTGNGGGSSSGSGGRNAGNHSYRIKDDDFTAAKPLLDRLAHELEDWYAKAGDLLRPDGFFDQQRAATEIGRILDKYLPQLFKLGAIDALTAIGEDPTPMSDALSRRARDFLAGYTPKLAAGMSETLGTEIRAELDKGLREGRSLAESIQSMRATLPDASGFRAERVVRTETAYVQVEAARQSYAEAGATHKELLLSSEPCEICEGVAADNPGAIPIDQPFAGVTTWFGPAQGPPFHPQCRCDLAPVFADDIKTVQATAYLRKIWEAAREPSA